MQILELEVKPYTLNFTFTARTSRGSMTERTVWFLHLSGHGKTGVGEVAPIPRLSPENVETVPEKLKDLKSDLEKISPPSTAEDCLIIARDLVGNEYPSIRFGLETALLDLLNGGQKILFDNDFSKGQKSIPINGLVWMDQKDEMIRQVDEKLAAGFDCIKLKVGALDFKEELEVLTYLRKNAPDVTIRLDANGAFETNEVLKKLNELAVYDIHSIEQPIAPHQEQAMKLVIEKSPIPVAFDEELIGIHDREAKSQLLENLNPNFLVLKPTLLGGMAECQEWIELAEDRNIDWWITSYLESNIGLNAIAQFTAETDRKLGIPHGLGTGGLFSNNIWSPMRIQEGQLVIDSSINWGIIPD